MVEILIVSDIRLYRDGLAALLAHEARLRVVGTSDSLGAALRQLESCRDCVVLLDMGLPESLAAMRALAACGRPVTVMALGISETRGDVISCAEAGARGYICRQSSLEELVAAVMGAVEGELRCSPRIAAALMDSVGRLAAGKTSGDPVQLTERELEIAGLLDQGLGNREIALRLHISVATVKVHVHHILEKLGSCRRGEAAAKLRRSGLLQPPRLHLVPATKTAV